MNHFHTPSFGDECLDLTNDVAEPPSSSSFMQLQPPIYMHMNDAALQQQQEQTQRMRTMDDGSAAAYSNDPNITADNMTNVDLCNGLLGAPQLMRPTAPPQTLASRKQLAGVTDGGDPNEPTKPLSAYSLFFRDTVSTIKQQNPNSSYNDLLRIVANMWDLLDEQRKSIYLNKHEMAMQEYIRQMNEYQQKQQQQGGHPQQHVPFQMQHDAAMGMQQQQQHDIFSDPMTSGGVLVNGQPMQHMTTATTAALPTTPSSAMQTKPAVFTIQPNQQQNITDATMMPSDVSLAGTSSNYSHLSSSLSLQHEASSGSMQSLQPTAGDNFFNESNDTSLNAGHFQMTDSLGTQQQQQAQQQQLQQQQTADHNQASQSQMLTSSLNSSNQVDNTQDQQTSAPPPEHEITPSVMPQVPQLCIRDSCTKPAILNINWDDEYCSNECVVAHCRNVFTTWVEENRREAEQLRQQQQQQFQQQHQQQQQQQQIA